MKTIKAFNLQLEVDDINEHINEDERLTPTEIIQALVGAINTSIKKFNGNPRLIFDSTDEEIQNGDIITEERE